MTARCSRNLAVLLMLLSMLALVGCGRDRIGPDGVITLTYASPYPPSHPFSRADIVWMDFVEQRSGGSLRIKPYWSGAIISSESSMLEIRHGVVDIGLITPIYTRGGAHAQRTQTGFYGGVRDIQDQIDVYKCLEQEFASLRNELTGLRVLAVQGGSFPGVLTRSRPVRSLEDLRGQRIRGPTEIVHVLRDLDADPVNLPMGETYAALAKNVIDGVVAPEDTFRSLHFNEVTRYFSTIRFARGAYPARAMSQAVWDDLPEDAQVVLSESQLVWEQALIRELVQARETGAAFGRENGMEFVDPAPGEQEKLDAVYNRSGRRTAEDLNRFGIDGVAIFERAQELVRARNSGIEDICQ